MEKEFWKNKKVLITGHTGFKGTWLSKILVGLQADVTGYALEPKEEKNLFQMSKIEDQMNSIYGDIRDLNKLMKIFKDVRPEIVFHLAAQPIVRESYNDPVYTYDTNVMGTVNICECVRKTTSCKSFLNITTDKVYKNNEWVWGYRENEPLDGFDPYSNSKSCSELVTHSYKNSFFDKLGIAVSTARAGNTIGGGDFAQDRIIPDCVRAVLHDETIIIRNPNSIRPYQHVLEPLSAYMLIAMEQYKNKNKQGYYNVGPDELDCCTTGNLVKKFCQYWGEDACYTVKGENGPHEDNCLKLDCSKIKAELGWKSKWHVDKAINKVVEWTRVFACNGNISEEMERQIKEYFQE